MVVGGCREDLRGILVSVYRKSINEYIYIYTYIYVYIYIYMCPICGTKNTNLTILAKLSLRKLPTGKIVANIP